MKDKQKKRDSDKSALQNCICMYDYVVNVG